MTVTPDVIGTPVSGAFGSAFNVTIPATMVAGAAVMVAVECDRTCTITVTPPAGATATKIGSTVSNGNNAGFGGLSAWIITGAAAGATISVTPSATAWIVANTRTFTGFGSIGSIGTAYSSSTNAAPSSGSATVSANNLLVNLMGWGAYTIASDWSTPFTPSGSNRWSGKVGNNTCGLAFADSTTSPTTFAGVLTAATLWASINVELVAAASGVQDNAPGQSTTAAAGVPVDTAPRVDDAAGQSTTTTVGTPGDTSSADVHDDAPGQATTAAAGTPVDIAPRVDDAPGVSTTTALGTPSDVVVSPTVDPAPGQATSSTAGTPLDSVLNPPNMPLDWVIQDLDADRSTAFFTTGDSTVDGYGGTSGNGWVGLVGKLLGDFYDVNVVVRKWSVLYTWGGLSTIRTATRGGAPTLTIFNGGVSSTTLINRNFDLSNNVLAPAGAIRSILIGEGFNDYKNLGMTPSAFTTSYQTYLTNLRAAAPSGVPICATTENQTSTFSGVNSDSNYIANFSALATAIVGSALPLSPAVQAATSLARVWMLDTRQAFDGYNLATVLGDGLHPNETGYLRLAMWILSILAPKVLYPVPGQDTATTTGTPVDAQPSSNTDDVPGQATSSGMGVSVDTAARVDDAPGQSTATTTGAPVDSTPYLDPARGQVTTSAMGKPDDTAQYVDAAGGHATATSMGVPSDTSSAPVGTSRAGTMTLTDTPGASMILANLP